MGLLRLLNRLNWASNQPSSSCCAAWLYSAVNKLKFMGQMLLELDNELRSNMSNVGDSNQFTVLHQFEDSEVGK